LSINDHVEMKNNNIAVKGKQTKIKIQHNCSIKMLLQFHYAQLICYAFLKS